jgi:Phage portal protein
MSEQIRGAGQPSWPLSPYQIQVSYGATANAAAGTIARGTGADWFGPLDPLRPIAPPEVAGRRFDFPPGYNLVTQPRAYEPVGFAELRAFADAYDLLRLVIETRKDQMERQRWRIRPRTPSLARKSATLDSDTQARIAAIQNFFQKPDGITRWKTWLRALLEDMFVIDAATLYCQRTRNGQLCALQQLDGATIKRVIDDWGRTPLPYAGADGATIYPPAYQQVLKGLPAVNYSAHDIIYRPRNVRTHRVYGYSPVQQVLMTVNIGLRRQLWQLDYFSEGSIPDALIGVPQNWTPDQIKQFQDYWDTEFAGDLAKRRRAKFVPGEAAAKVVQTKEPSHKDDFDEWLARIICYAFSVPPQWATKVMNRATADNQSAQAEDEGLDPTKEWVKDLVDEIIAGEFASPDLELAWLDEDEADPKGLEAVLEGRVKLGAVTLNEMRDALGLDPYSNAAADRPMVLTATGYVPIEANADGEGTKTPAGSTRPTTNAPLARDVAKPFVTKDYDPDQPRVPAGNSDGGQWTSEDVSSAAGGVAGAPNDRIEAINGQVQGSPANDSRVLSDATPDNTWIPGAQYAGGIEDDENETRSGGRFEGTPAQLLRQQIAEREFRSALSDVLRLDPTWKPSLSLVDPNEIEGDIKNLEAWTKEAQEYFERLRELSEPLDRNSGDAISPSTTKTGDPLVDSTTEKLNGILDRVVARIGPRPDLTAGQYGQLVHDEFEREVRAAHLPGIADEDLEKTFGVSEGASYGEKDSIRPDVVLRDDQGNIVAIYDVKTGRGFSSFSVIKYRLRTGSDSFVPLFELHPNGRTIWKQKNY